MSGNAARVRVDGDAGRTVSRVLVAGLVAWGLACGTPPAAGGSGGTSSIGRSAEPAGDAQASGEATVGVEEPAESDPTEPFPDVPFWESPDAVVEAMLELAPINKDDVLYDLGSGDGRIVIRAALLYGARGVGVELQRDLVEQSTAAAAAAGLEDLVEFRQGDLFEADFRDATVVAIYLYPKVNARLRPILEDQLAPGTPVVSHRYEIAGWTPVATVKVEGRPVYRYLVP